MSISLIPAPIDIENARQVVAGQDICNRVLASQRKNHLSPSTRMRIVRETISNELEGVKGLPCKCESPS